MGLAGTPFVLSHTFQTPSWPGVPTKIRQIRKLVEMGKRDPKIYALAGQITFAANVAGKDQVGELKALYDYVAKEVPWRSDINKVETFADPASTLEWHRGDCDDHTSLLMSLAESMGYSTKARVIERKGAGGPSHIYPMVGLPRSAPRKWIPLDIAGGQGPNWELAKKLVGKTVDYGVFGGRSAPMNGLGATELQVFKNTDQLVPSPAQRREALNMHDRIRETLSRGGTVRVKRPAAPPGMSLSARINWPWQQMFNAPINEPGYKSTNTWGRRVGSMGGLGDIVETVSATVPLPEYAEPDLPGLPAAFKVITPSPLSPYSATVSDVMKDAVDAAMQDNMPFKKKAAPVVHESVHQVAAGARTGDPKKAALVHGVMHKSHGKAAGHEHRPDGGMGGLGSIVRSAAAESPFPDVAAPNIPGLPEAFFAVAPSPLSPYSPSVNDALAGLGAPIAPRMPGRASGGGGAIMPIFRSQQGVQVGTGPAILPVAPGGGQQQYVGGQQLIAQPQQASDGGVLQAVAKIFAPAAGGSTAGSGYSQESPGLTTSELDQMAETSRKSFLKGAMHDVLRLFDKFGADTLSWAQGGFRHVLLIAVQSRNMDALADLRRKSIAAIEKEGLSGLGRVRSIMGLDSHSLGLGRINRTASPMTPGSRVAAPHLRAVPVELRELGPTPLGQIGQDVDQVMEGLGVNMSEGMGYLAAINDGLGTWGLDSDHYGVMSGIGLGSDGSDGMGSLGGLKFKVKIKKPAFVAKMQKAAAKAGAPIAHIAADLAKKGAPHLFKVALVTLNFPVAFLLYKKYGSHVFQGLPASITATLHKAGLSGYENDGLDGLGALTPKEKAALPYIAVAVIGLGVVAYFAIPTLPAAFKVAGGWIAKNSGMAKDAVIAKLKSLVGLGSKTPSEEAIATASETPPTVDAESKAKADETVDAMNVAAAAAEAASASAEAKVETSGSTSSAPAHRGWFK